MSFYRYCDSPPPSSEEEGCNGPAEETVICHQRPCECTFDMDTFENIFGYAPPDTIGKKNIKSINGRALLCEKVGLNLSQTTNFRLFQTKRLCRQQF